MEIGERILILAGTHIFYIFTEREREIEREREREIYIYTYTHARTLPSQNSPTSM